MTGFKIVVAAALEAAGKLLVQDGNHGEYRPRPSEFSNVGTSFIRAADMANGRLLFDKAGRINDSALQRIRKGIGKPQDVILSHKGTVGKVALADPDCEPFVCSPQTTFWRSLDHEVIDPRYLFFAIRSPGFISQLRTIENETDMAAYVPLTQQRRLRLSVPPIGEQRRITSLLGVLDDKIAVNDRIARTCRELGQTIFGSRILRSRAAIQDVCAIVMGQSPPGESYNETGDGLPFYQGTRDFGFHLPRRRVWSTAVTRHAATGDVLVSVRAPVGEVNVASEPCGIGRGLAALRAHAYPHTLHHALMADSAAWSPFEGEGTVFSSINKKQFHSLEIRWPDPGDEARLETDLRVLDERLIAALVENQSLEELRDTLLPELMSGRLRVRDAEKVVEDAV